MVQAYNFLASWQLFPEKGIYEFGERPISGIYRIEASEDKRLTIHHHWVSHHNEAYTSTYSLLTNGEIHPFEKNEHADHAQATFTDSITFEVHFYRSGQVVTHIIHEIQPNGYLKVTVQGNIQAQTPYTNVEIYHKQLSVLPYSASVAGAVVKPTEEGVIKHKALLAMEEQTNMQLEQIRRQIELLALQAQEIQKRKELSHMVYNARLSFKPNIGQTYYLYEKNDGSHMLSLVSPREWGNGPFKRFVAAVQLLADHTWKELG